MSTMNVLFANNASSRLYQDTNAASGTIRVQSGHGSKFPNPVAPNFFFVTVEDRRSGQIEIMKCTARSGDILTVQRAQEGTAAQDFLLGATVSNRLTASTMAELFNTVGYTETEADAKFVDITGDTMTGPLFLPAAAPTNPTQAANKQYVDDTSIDEAPGDGRAYARVGVDHSWLVVGTGITEAPNDGVIYGRQSLGWAASVTKTAFDTLTGRVDGVEGVNNTQQSQIDGHSSEIAALQGDDVTQDSRLSAIEAKNVSQDSDIALKAPIASPTFTGDPKAPTPAAGDNDTSIATTAFVTAAVGVETAARSAADTTLQSNINLKADIASPTFTGDPKAPTPATADNDTSIATTQFVKAQGYITMPGALAVFAPLQDPHFTGDPTAPTPTAGDNDTSIATTAFVTSAISAAQASGNYVLKAGDTMTGTLTLPTLAANSGASAQTNAAIKARAGNANAFEWGHSNSAGYANTLGYYSTSGYGFVGFNCEAGTNANTLRTRGLAGAYIRGNNAGGVVIGTVATASADNQTPTDLFTFNSAGTFTVSQYVVANASFCGNGTVGILAAGQGTGQAGTAYLRPDGNSSGVGQFSTDSSGNGTLSVGSGSVAQLSAGAIYSIPGTAYGVTLQKSASSASIRISNNQTASAVVAGFYNPNGNIGNIITSASATAYNTSSDERLKTFTGPLSGDDAIAIIRADPVRRFTWNADGSEAVGWGAQTSYEVSHDLATPPPLTELDGLPKEPGEAGFVPWGMDQAKRTPYLWAALAAALDRIEALEARIAALEPANTGEAA